MDNSNLPPCGEIALVPKPFCCPSGHTLGYISRGPDHIRRLHLPYATIEGNAILLCSLCGLERAWSPGVYSLHNILKKTVRASKHS